ncbi:MAG: prolipoprotein diacylglyceryl transferase [Acidimicrobiia bacterium]
MTPAITYSPIPILELGPLNLSLHGVAAAVGFALGSVLMIREVRRRGFSAEQYWSVLAWALVGAILGARLLTTPAHLGDAGFDLAAAISPSGSYSILGGFTGGVLGGWLRVRMLKLDIWVSLDMAAPGMALGTVIGRLGDLAIVEHLGRSTNFFLGFTIQPGHDVAPQHDVLECTVAEAVDGVCGTYHHTALYDMLGAIALLIFLLWIRRAWTSLHYGQVFAVWMLWYGTQRFFIDFARIGVANADRMAGGLTWSQWAALAAALGGIGLYYWLRRKPLVSPEEDQARGAKALTADS